ncbi:hypothetical protein ZIOFF_042548 [Zingiber officinale]|uniref:Uncharacterized protein n=1 Tax=Zingiber officinale TaxID=94328 RepID=A0A8J5KVK7_ZINOF|nr:hypothetical protein ZIOFF_042548 [Zingiber officinale]
MEGECSNTFTKFVRLVNLMSTRPLVSLSAVSLALNAAVSAYMARRDPPAMAFALFCYVDLLLLFLLVGKFERLMGEGAGGSPEEKARVRAAVWALSASLVLVFGWRSSSEIAMWSVKLAIRVAAAALAGGGLCGLVLFQKEAVLVHGEEN